MSPKILQGSESISQIKQILKGEEASSSILLITGNKSYEGSGAKKWLEPLLENKDILHLSGFKNMAMLKDIEEIVARIKKRKIDFIIAVGGGTVLDTAKAVSCLCNEEGNLADFVKGGRKIQGNPLRKLLIPTTAGTGSEITPFAVIYIEKTKYSLEHPFVMPDYVVLAPELTYSLDAKTTAETGCDALAQAIEGFWSLRATEESKKYSRKAIPLILANLQQAVNDPNPKNREAMLWGAHLAGKSIAIAKTTAAHALSYPFTSYYHVPHGHAVMLTLPYFFEINENTNDQSDFSELLLLLHVKNGKEAKGKLLALMEEVHLERKLSNLGLKEKDLQIILDNGFNPDRINNNPVKVNKEMVWQIVKAIY